MDVSDVEVAATPQNWLFSIDLEIPMRELSKEIDSKNDIYWIKNNSHQRILNRIFQSSRIQIDGKIIRSKQLTEARRLSTKLSILNAKLKDNRKMKMKHST